MKEQNIQHEWYNFITDPLYSLYFDQNIALPDPLPIAKPSNNPLDDLNTIELIQINSEYDLYNALKSMPDITSILNKYENKINIDNDYVQMYLD